MTLKTTRRSFLAGAAGAGIGLLQTGAKAAIPPRIPLKVTTRDIVVKGRAAKVYGILSPSGAPGLVMSDAEEFLVELTNALSEPTLIHWHGQTPPSDQDGTPMLSQPPIQAGSMFNYEFPARAGTHWMHSHVGLQEQRLLAAPLIVRSRADFEEDMQEHVVMLHDFTFREPQEILDELKAGGGGHAMHHGGWSMTSCMTPSSPMTARSTIPKWCGPRKTDGSSSASSMRRHRAICGSTFRACPVSSSLSTAIRSRLSPARASYSRSPSAPTSSSRCRMRTAHGRSCSCRKGASERTGIVLATASGAISKIDGTGEAAPAVTLEQELQLRAVQPLRPEPITRTEIVKLTGGGADYLWGLNDKSEVHATLFTVKLGERIAVALHNETEMSHPMHLHGHHFQVVAIDGTVFPGAMRDTVLVPPKSTVIIAFDAENPGNWAFHCHHLYHMNAGMMGAIGYTSAA